MGCRVMATDMGITVQGGDLRGIEVDMGDCPDVVPTLAVVAAFARGTTRIVNIAHLREKECDRIGAVVSQLIKMGVQADQGADWLSVTGVDIEEGSRLKGSHHGTSGGKNCIRGASIETFNDHRIAMAFSVAGLVVDNMIIENQSCVNKSFPTYWEVFETLK
jgi:3-phosphoshikimate 1-carboxyvinyltransferase